MAFNIYRDLFSYSIGVTAIPPTWKPTDIIPHFTPQNPYKKISPTRDYTIIQKIIKGIMTEIYDKGLFCLDIKRTQFKKYLFKIWAMYNQRYQSYILEIPLTTPDIDFPQLTCIQDPYITHKITIAVNIAEAEQFKDYTIVLTDIQYNLVSKKAEVHTKTFPSTAAEIGTIDETGKITLFYNFIYLIDTNSTDKTCTPTYWISYIQDSTNHFNITLQEPFQNTIKSTIMYNSTGTPIASPVILQRQADNFINFIYNNYETVLTGYYTKETFIQHLVYTQNHGEFTSLIDFTNILFTDTYYEDFSIEILGYFTQTGELWINPIIYDGSFGMETYIIAIVGNTIGNGNSLNIVWTQPQIFKQIDKNIYAIKIGKNATPSLICIYYKYVLSTEITYSRQFWLTTIENKYTVSIPNDTWGHTIESSIEIKSPISYKEYTLYRMIRAISTIDDFIIIAPLSYSNIFARMKEINTTWLTRKNISNNFCVWNDPEREYNAQGIISYTNSTKILTIKITKSTIWEHYTWKTYILRDNNAKPELWAKPTFIIQNIDSNNEFKISVHGWEKKPYYIQVILAAVTDNWDIQGSYFNITLGIYSTQYSDNRNALVCYDVAKNKKLMIYAENGEYKQNPF